ncbi:MAG: dockerin type I domain-containing protein [Pirellulaceae bacterium]|nr:dockerin type I domain-containing protein [Pirellulaceae bacterium]
MGAPSPCRVENDAFLDIELNATWPHASGYNFGERGLRPHLISLQLLLASSLPPTQLVGQLTLADGDAWAAFTADSYATLTLTAQSEPDDGVVLEVYDSSFLPLALGRGTSLDVPVVQHQSYVIYVSGTPSVRARLILDQSGTYTNPLLPLDVNADGVVSPLDALLIINRLNASGSRFMSGANSTAPYCDTNADLMITPIDALLVINHLNYALGGAEGEFRQVAPDRGAEASWSLSFAPSIIPATISPQSIGESSDSDDGLTFRANRTDATTSVIPLWVGCAHDADADDLYEAIALELMRRQGSSESGALLSEEAIDFLLLTGQWER